MFFQILLARNGGYGEWTNGTCSKTCGNGTMVRTRKCDNPTPLRSGDNCTKLGPSQETVSCNEFPCPGMLKGTEKEIIESNLNNVH